MGKSNTPTFRLVIRSNGTAPSVLSWTGKASKRALLDWIDSYHKSLESNGCNAHISEALGFVPYIIEAKIIRQSTDEVELQWNAPAFMAL